MGARSGGNLGVTACLVALLVVGVAGVSPIPPASADERQAPPWMDGGLAPPSHPRSTSRGDLLLKEARVHAAAPLVPCGTGLTDVPSIPWRQVRDVFVGDVLFAIDGTGPDDVWAVGEFANSYEGHMRDAIEHWDGTAWTRMPLDDVYDSASASRRDDPGRNARPADAYFSFPLNDVVAVTPTDAYASGGDTYDELLRWDGARWRAVRAHVRYPTIAGLDAAGPDEVWAVGTAYARRTDRGYAMAERWDGTSWQTVDVPTPDGRAGAFGDVKVFAPDDVWIAGTLRGAGFVSHWDGSAWRVTKLPSTGRPVRLRAISALGPHDLWVGGSSGRKSVVFRLHGGGWKVMPGAPAIYGGIGTIEPISPTDVWAAPTGEYGYSIAHWDGSTWTTLPSYASGIRRIPGGEVWFAGGDGTQRLCTADASPGSFSQDRAEVSQDGFAEWRMDPANSGPVRLTDESGFGVVETGPRPPASTAIGGPFIGAGRYPIGASPGGARMVIDVRPTVWPAAGHVETGFRVSFASYRLPKGAVADVQVERPGGTWAMFQTDVHLATVRFTPDAGPGTYRFRSRLRNPSTGAATGWSTGTPVEVAPSVPAPCTGAWQRFPIETPLDGDEALGVAVGGADDAWVVGQGGYHLGYEPLVEHWAGGWSRLTMPKAYGLTAVEQVAPGRVWAGGYKVLISHRDGTWRTAPVPGLTGPWQIRRIESDGHEDVWAVGGKGYYGDGPSFLLHLTSHGWRVVDVPVLQEGTNFFGAVAPRSPDDVWVVGSHSAPHAGWDRETVLALHWNGTSWRRLGQHSPVGSLKGGLGDATIAPGGALWAVGDEIVANGSPYPDYRPLALRLEAGDWTRHDPPSGRDSVFPHSIAFTGRDDGWGVGDRRGRAGFIHWNGTEWEQYRLHAPYDSRLNDVDAGPDGSLFAVGELDDYDYAPYAALVYRRC